MTLPQTWVASPYALLHGDDGDGRKAAVRAWKARHVDPEWEDFSLTICREGCPWAEVHNALMEMAPMGATRVVVVPEAENLLERAKEIPEPIKKILAGPVEGTRLLLVSRTPLSAAAGKALGSKPLSEWNKQGRVLKVGALDPKEVLAFLEAEAHRFGLKLERDAAQLLQERLGGNPGVLRRAMEVLDLVSERRVISVPVVDVLTFRMSEQKAFAWTESWQRGTLAQALKALRQALEDDPGAAVALVSQAGRDVGRVATLVAALAEGVTSEAELAARLQLPGNQTFLLGRAYLPVARKLGRAGVRRLLELTAATDRDIKGVALTPTAPLTLLTAELWRAWNG